MEDLAVIFKRQETTQIWKLVGFFFRSFFLLNKYI